MTTVPADGDGRSYLYHVYIRGVGPGGRRYRWRFAVEARRREDGRWLATEKDVADVLYVAGHKGEAIAVRDGQAKVIGPVADSDPVPVELVAVMEAL